MIFQNIRFALLLRTALIAVGLFVFSGCATPPVEMPAANRFGNGRTWRIACVGDSITYGEGAGRPRTEGYPAVLQQMLGISCDVRNFAYSGATIHSFPDNLWQDLLFWEPHVVVVLLGTNDARTDFRSNRNAYIQRYMERIAELRQLSSKPEIYVCIPICSRNDLINRVISQQVAPAAREIARVSGSGLIDLYRPFNRMSGFLADDLHPSVEGHRLMAAEIYRVIQLGAPTAKTSGSDDNR